MSDIADFAPNSGRVLKEDSTVINMADISSGNSVIFHDEAVSASNGTELEVGGYKTLAFEIYGTSTSRTVEFKCKSESGTLRSIMGVKVNDFSTATSTNGTGEIWQFDITGLTSIIIDLTAVAGGNVSVKGRVIG